MTLHHNLFGIVIDFINVYRPSGMIDEYVKEFKNNHNVCESELSHHQQKQNDFYVKYEHYVDQHRIH